MTIYRANHVLHRLAQLKRGMQCHPGKVSGHVFWSVTAPISCKLNIGHFTYFGASSVVHAAVINSTH